MLFTERFCFCYPLYIFITSSAHCALVMTRMNGFTLGLLSGMLLGQHQANSWAGGDSATVKSWDQLYQQNKWTQNPRHLTIFTDISTRSQWVGLCGMVKKIRITVCPHTQGKYLTPDMQISAICCFLYVLKLIILNCTCHIVLHFCCYSCPYGEKIWHM